MAHLCAYAGGVCMYVHRDNIDSNPRPRPVTGNAHSLNVTSSAKVAVVSSSVLMAAPPDTWKP